MNKHTIHNIGDIKIQEYNNGKFCVLLRWSWMEEYTIRVR